MPLICSTHCRKVSVLEIVSCLHSQLSDNYAASPSVFNFLAHCDFAVCVKLAEFVSVLRCLRTERNATKFDPCRKLA